MIGYLTLCSLCVYTTVKVPTSVIAQILILSLDELENKYRSQQIRDVTTPVCSLSVIVHCNVSIFQT